MPWKFFAKFGLLGNCEKLLNSFISTYRREIDYDDIARRHESYQWKWGIDLLILRRYPEKGELLLSFLN